MMGNRKRIGERWKKCVAFLMAAWLLALAGCAQKQSAEDETFRVVTSFYPMYIMAINITDNVDGVQVENMAGQQTGCLHDYQLQSMDMQNLQKADVFVINGAGMESFIEKVMLQLPELPVITASRGIELLESGHEHSHEDSHEHAHTDVEEDFENHAHEESGEMNPHVWVSITDASLQVMNIAEGLAAADPSHAEAYLKNAEIYCKKLEALRTEMHSALDTVQNKRIITFHEAFPYFAEEFDLEIVKVINREPDSQPSAKELGETILQIRETGVKAVFAEPQYSESAAHIVAAESGAGMYFLDPCTSGEDHPDAYLNAMRSNMETLKTALSGKE